MSDPFDLFSDLNVTHPEGFVPAGATPESPVSTSDTPEPVATSTSDAPTCEVCGRAVEYSGRGRKPKRCPEHKTRTGKDGETAPRAAKTAKSEDARLEAITGDLLQGVGELAGVLYPLAPVTAGTLVMQGPSGASALVRIASDYPRMLAGLEAAAKAIPFLELGKFLAALIMAVMVDMGKLEPEGRAAEYLKVADAAREVGWKSDTPTDAPVTGFMPTTRPPSFRLVEAA